MRYIIQIAAMFTDIIIIICVAITWKELPGVIALIFTILTYKTWRKTGGFNAWMPSEVRKFLKNAKELGL